MAAGRCQRQRASHPRGLPSAARAGARMNDPLTYLLRVSREPEFVLLKSAPAVAADAALGWAEAGLTVRVVRGRKMRSYQALFDEFAAALQFPWYFGENGNAFDECLTDLAWLPVQAGYVIMVDNPGAVLADAQDEALEWLVGSLRRATEEWATPIVRGESWDRPSVPFHVVLHVDEEDAPKVEAAWSAAGAVVASYSG